MWDTIIIVIFLVLIFDSTHKMYRDTIRTINENYRVILANQRKIMEHLNIPEDGKE